MDPISLIFIRHSSVVFLLDPVLVIYIFQESLNFHLLPKVWLWDYLIYFYCIYSYSHFYFPIIFIYVCLFCLILPKVS